MRAGTIAAVCLSMCLSASLTFADEQEKRLITVTGEGTIEVDPDLATIKLGIDSWDVDPVHAKKKNDSRLKKLQALAKGFKIKNGDMDVSRIDIEPTYRKGEPEFTGCYIRRTVVLKLKDVTKFEDVLLHSLKSGANKVYSVTFRTTRLEELKAQARAKAIRSAKKQAESMASELGRQIGDPHSVREDECTWYPSGKAPSGVDETSLDKIVVKAKVTVGFELK